MADLTFGEVGKIIQFNLINNDPTQSPPTSLPMDLTNATEVDWIYSPAASSEKPNTINITVAKMSIVNALGGVVQYALKVGDLPKPPDVGKTGVIRWCVKVTFNNGVILFSNFDGQFTIKDDSQL
jgi:hypothetical protein